MPSPHPPAAPPPRRRDPAEGSLPAVRGTRANNSAGDASCELLPDGRHANFHKCRCYGHEKALPNYRLLAIPKTNNYYAATGGCPCIPRAPAHPGSWRLRKAQMRSATHRCGHGCINRQAATNPSKNTCCVHTGYQYGWKEGPHTVLGKNTAASGKCDTFGNLAFKSTSKKYLPPEDDVSDLSSVDAGKLEDLEGLILSEHQERMRVENDVMELEQVQSDGTADLYKRDRGVDDRRRHLENATEEQLNELLREVSGIVDRPLNQTNMEVLRRIIHRQEMLQRKREYFAAKESNAVKE